jgi:hypothetical protein
MTAVVMLVVFTALTGFAGSAQASVDQKASAFVLCKNKKDVRTIRILPDGAKADNCSITYSKGGVEEVVGSNRAMATCKSIAKNIQFNLESSKWSCRNVQSAQVTTGSEVITQ